MAGSVTQDVNKGSGIILKYCPYAFRFKTIVIFPLFFCIDTNLNGSKKKGFAFVTSQHRLLNNK